MNDTWTLLMSVIALLILAAFLVSLFRWRKIRNPLLRKKEKEAGLLAELECLHRKEIRRKEEQTEIIHGVVHDLRSPLNNIIGFTDILLSGMEGEVTEPQQKDLEIILAGARSLTDQVDDLLEMDRITSGTVSLNRTSLDPAAALRETVEKMGRKIETKGCAVSLEAPDNLPLLYADSERLQQILIRLLEKTLHFLQGGEILFHAQCSDVEGNPLPHSSPIHEPFVRISMTVRNTGKEKQLLESFFRRLFPTGTEGSSVSGGGSLGVRIARELIRLQGGRTGVESIDDRVRGLWLTLPTVKDSQ